MVAEHQSLVPACLHHTALLEILLGRSQKQKQFSEAAVHTKYIPVQLKYIPSTFEYVLCMYSVHTQYRIMPSAFPDSVMLKSCYSVYFGVQILCLLGMADCCIGTPHAIVQYRLVLLCTGTYFLVMLFTILRISSFRFGTQYIQICTAISAVQIWMY